MSAVNVPTNGFQAPPTPVVPEAPGGFAVPPAGAPASVPPTTQQPIAAPGQVPGWVQNPIPQPAQQPAQGQPSQDVASLTAALTAAIAAQQPAQTAANPVSSERPGWMGASANEFDVESISDPIIKSMATVLQTAGKDLDLDRVLGRALTFGDPNLVDVAYIAEKGGPQAQQLAEIAKGIVQAVEAKAQAVTQEVHALAGGEANWSAAVAAFNQAAPQELKMAVAQMLNSTKDASIKAGAKLVSEFGKNSGYIPQQGAALLNSASVGAQAQGLTKAQFQEELRKLRPDTAGFEEAREALFARRAVGRRVGL